MPSPVPNEPASPAVYVAVPNDDSRLSSGSMYGSTGVSAAVPDVAKQDIRASVAALREGFASGATRSPAVRRELLLQLERLLIEGEPLLAEAMWRDLHKHPSESGGMDLMLTRGELQEHIDYFEDWTKPELCQSNILNQPGLSYVVREPLGVVCIIGTWNYPIQLLLVPLISAIAAGNCALLRLPGEDTVPHTVNALITLLDKYMDKRYVRYVYGGVPETKAMLTERFDLIFATGGSFLGKIVARAAAEHLTPTVLELGGKSPAIVDASADLDLTARRLAWGAFVNSGQTCVRPDYVLVDERVGDQLVAKLKAAVATMYGEDAKTSESYARVVNTRMYERLHALLDKDRPFVAFGGESDAKERYIAPTVLNFKTDLAAFESAASMQDEIFGPLLPMYYYPANDLNVPIRFATTREKPLALYHFSRNGKNKQRVVSETSAGSMMVNDCMMQLSNGHVPFGGVGNSGSGAYHGRAGVEAFSHHKTVIYKNALLDLPVRYPPYTPTKSKLLRMLQFPFTRLHMRLFKALPVVVLIAIVAVIIKASV